MRKKLNLTRLNKASLDNQEKNSVKAGNGTQGPSPDIKVIKALCEDWCSVTHAKYAEYAYFVTDF